ncbi:TlpA disulfide reductase family protein [Tsukamurella sp. 1534]|uniref:TlpA family protein disulfide reductase n=1 Tax=Tsukamurella sp. 1534 TaxID=1151061 RepID=UPI0002EE23AD|nr:TlpA disulfide reductase family protein [Tsukamurella sp. 1534]
MSGTEPGDDPTPLLPGEKPGRLSGTTRWLIVCAVLALALGVAIWPRESGDGGPAPEPSGAPSASVSPGELGAARGRAALPPCPTGPGPAAGPLAGLTLDCLGDGRPVDVGAALAGKPALVNVWAYWCGPCRTELPALGEFAGRAGDRLSVLTVHADPNPAFALDLLTELNVKIPTVEDPRARVATLLGAPRAYPVTVLLRADGTVAGVHARPFTSADDVAAVVRDQLGIAL